MIAHCAMTSDAQDLDIGPSMAQPAYTHSGRQHVSHFVDPEFSESAPLPPRVLLQNEQPDIHELAMAPTKKPRKKKAPTLHASAWEPVKERIIELHITRQPALPLRQVKEIIETEYGFVAEYVFLTQDC